MCFNKFLEWFVRQVESVRLMSFDFDREHLRNGLLEDQMGQERAVSQVFSVGLEGVCVCLAWWTLMRVRKWETNILMVIFDKPPKRDEAENNEAENNGEKVWKIMA